jgi:phenylpropionate dioxygenase-like ring-hydroxylating dioxygenase large terminal subunit
MFLLNQWYAAALPHELTNKPLARTICGRALVMFRTETGKPVALDDRCAHRYAPLSAGICTGETIMCPYHGLVFDGTGACVHAPHQSDIPPTMRVASYPLVERSGWAWIWLGEKDAVNPAEIPDYWWFTHPDWVSFQKNFYVRANWQLCTDNILDLSHTPFIHAKTVGTPEMPKIPVRTWTEGNKLFNRRVMQQVTPGPIVVKWGNFKGMIDRVTTTEWLPAANVSVELYYEDPQARITLRLTNPATPETETSTHCWFGWSRDFGPKDENHPEAIRFRDESFSVMDEDVAIMEKQQAVVDRGGSLPTVAIKADSTLIQARRIVDRLMSDPGNPGQQLSA